MADLWRPKGAQFFDNSGDPLNGGKFYYYDATTTNERTVYQDDGAATPWTQPITLDANGRLTASIYIPTGDFKEKLTTSADVEIYTEDNIPGAITIPSATYASPDIPVISKATDYTIVAGDQGKWIKTDTTGGNVQLTLPDCTTAGDGFVVFIQHTVAANVTTIVRAGSDTLNGGSSLRLLRQWGTIVIVGNGGTAYTAMSADFYYATIAKTTTYTVLPSDVGKLITGDATSAGFTITLPPAATAGDGFEVTFLKIDSSTAAVTIDGDDTETINGATTYVLSAQWQSVRLRCNGTTWYALGITQLGKQTIWVPAGAMVPRTTNGAAAGAVELTTNDVMIVSKDFDQTTQEFAQFDIAFPKSWDEGTVTFVPVWSHASGASFGVVWSVAAVAIGNDDAGDVAFGTEQTSTDTGGTANDIYVGPESSAITIAGTPAEGDVVVFRVARNVSDGSDDLDADARLHGVKILYTINTLRDN